MPIFHSREKQSGGRTIYQEHAADHLGPTERNIYLQRQQSKFEFLAAASFMFIDDERKQTGGCTAFHILAKYKSAPSGSIPPSHAAVAWSSVLMHAFSPKSHKASPPQHLQGVEC